MDWTPYIGTIVTVVIAVISGYVAVASRIAKLETRIEDNEKLTRIQIDNLRRDVEKHNNGMERIYELEQDTAVQEQRITANEARIKKLEGAA